MEKNGHTLNNNFIESNDFIRHHDQRNGWKDLGELWAIAIFWYQYFSNGWLRLKKMVCQ